MNGARPVASLSGEISGRGSLAPTPNADAQIRSGATQLLVEGEHGATGAGAARRTPQAGIRRLALARSRTVLYD